VVGTTTPTALGIAEGSGVSLTLPAWATAGTSAVAATRAKVQRLDIFMMIVLFESPRAQSLVRSYDGCAAAFFRCRTRLGGGGSHSCRPGRQDDVGSFRPLPRAKHPAIVHLGVGIP